VIVTYGSGLPIADLGKEETLVIQVKSYTSQMDEQTAIAQIEEAVRFYSASAGMIFSTAEASPEFRKAFEVLKKKLEESDVPLVLIAGIDAAKFVLRHGGNLLFSE